MTRLAHFRIETPEVFTIAETACRLKVSRTTAYQLIKRGELAAVRVGADMRVPADAITRFLNGHLVPVRVPYLLARPSRSRYGHT